MPTPSGGRIKSSAAAAVSDTPCYSLMRPRSAAALGSAGTLVRGVRAGNAERLPGGQVGHRDRVVPTYLPGPHVEQAAPVLGPVNEGDVQPRRGDAAELRRVQRLQPVP